MVKMMYVVTFLLLLNFKLKKIFLIIYIYIYIYIYTCVCGWVGVCGRTRNLIVLFINFVFHLFMLLLT